MESLRWQIFERYGARARIIRAEKIQTGGLFGMGAVTSFEVTVEVDGRAAHMQRAETSSASVVRRPPTSRRGLADLLADADDGDSAKSSAALVVSTAKPDFDAVLGKVSAQLGVDSGSSSMEVFREINNRKGRRAGESILPETPRPSTIAGDLIVLVGLREQPLHVAWSMIGALEGGAELRTAGVHRSNGVGHVFIDSAEVKKAQALAAVDGKPLVIAFSVGARGSSSPTALASVVPNQLWLVVDALHKPEDTQVWTRQTAWYATPDALAVLGSTETATPETVNELGYPVGWVDGYQATSATL